MADAAAANVEPIGFTYTVADFLDAQRLHHTLSLRGRRLLIRVAAILIAVSAAVVFASGEWKEGVHAIEFGLACAAIYLCLIAVLILMARLFVLPRAARRQFSQLKEFGGPVKVGVSSPHILFTTKNGFSEIPTEDFLKWAENGKSILLYRADRQFSFVPKRVTSEAFHRSLVAELTRAGVPKASFSNS